MMNQPYLLCLDIDGTLTVTPEGDIPQENREAILRARQAGHFVCINTGRGWHNMPQNLKDSSLFDGWICANGSYFRIGSRVLRNETIPHPIAHELLDYFFYEDGRFCLFEGETTLLKVREYSELYGSPGTRIHTPQELDTRFAGARFNVVSCEGHLSQAFRDRFGARLNIFQCATYADCTAQGCSKAVGMQIAARHFGIPQTRTAAFGDSGNDLPMFEAAGISIAVGNAPEDVRAAADHVTASNTECGVAKAIRQLFLSDGGSQYETRS